LRVFPQRLSPSRLSVRSLGPLCLRGRAVNLGRSPTPGVAVPLARSLSPLALLLALAVSVLARRPDSAPSPFRPLALPAPNLIRNGAGRPGSRYWEQRGDHLNPG